MTVAVFHALSLRASLARTLAILLAMGLTAASPAVPVIDAISPADGLLAGGETVQVLGSGFDRSPTLLLNGTPAPGYSTLSQTEIVFQAPAFSGDPQLEVSVFNGDTSNTVYYNYNGQPTIDGIAAAGDFAAGHIFTVQGSNLDPVSGLILFNGIPAQLLIRSLDVYQGVLPQGFTPGAPVEVLYVSQAFGLSAPVGTVAYIPEPAALGTLVAGLAVIAGRRRLPA